MEQKMMHDGKMHNGKMTLVRSKWRTFLQPGILMQTALRKSGRHYLKVVMWKSLMDFMIT